MTHQDSYVSNRPRPKAGYHCKINDLQWEWAVKKSGVPHPRDFINDLITKAMLAENGNGHQEKEASRTGYNGPVRLVREEEEAPKTTQMKPTRAVPIDSLFEKRLQALCQPGHPDVYVPHLIEKASWVWDGWRGEGMNDPDQTMSYILEDLEDPREWEELPEGVQNVHRRQKQMYRRWQIEMLKKIK